MKTRLVIPDPLLRQLLVQALMAPYRTAQCAVGRHQREQETRWLAHSGSTVNTQRLTVLAIDTAPSAPQLEAALNEPQVAAVLALSRDDQFWGATHSGDVIGPISQLDLGDLRVRGAVWFPGDLTPVEDTFLPYPAPYPERHSRTIEALRWDTWETLAQWNVALIGAGRMGAVLCEAFARLGVRRTDLFDADLIEEHNLGEMLGVGVADIGEFKAAALAWHLQRLLGEGVNYYAETIVAAHRRVLEADLIVCCVDNDEARLAAGILSVVFHLPLLDVGTGIFRQPEGATLRGADVRLLLPGAGCLVCFGGLVDYEGALRRLALRTTSPRRAWWQQRAGSLLSLNLLAAARAMDLLTELAAGQVTTSTWLQLRASEAHELRETRVTHNAEAATANCPLCARAGLGDVGIYWDEQ